MSLFAEELAGMKREKSKTKELTGACYLIFKFFLSFLFGLFVDSGLFVLLLVVGSRPES